MYMNLSEKKAYVDQDFKNSKLCQMGPVPEDMEKIKEYFHYATRYGQEFLNKYSGKRRVFEYAEELVMDWFDTIEAISREIETKVKREEEGS